MPVCIPTSVSAWHLDPACATVIGDGSPRGFLQRQVGLLCQLQTRPGAPCLGGQDHRARLVAPLFWQEKVSRLV